MTGILAKHKAQQRFGAVFQGSLAPHLFEPGEGVAAPNDVAAFRTSAAAMTLFAHERTVLEEREAQRIRSGQAIKVDAVVRP